MNIRQFDQPDRIEGATDGTQIGNVADALKVFLSFSPGATSGDFFFEVSKGNIAGHKQVLVAGRNPEAGTTDEDVWNVGGDYTFPSSASTLSIVSASAADTSAGTGARTIRVTGLTTGFVEQEKDYTLNGLTPVVPSDVWLRVNKVIVLTAGSGEENAGNITITHTGDSVVVGRLDAGDNSTLQANFTIPAGKTGFIINFVVGSQLNKVAFIPRIRAFGGVFVTATFLESNDIPFQIIVRSPAPLAEKTDVRIMAATKAGNSFVSTTYRVILVDN